MTDHHRGPDGSAASCTTAVAGADTGEHGSTFHSDLHSGFTKPQPVYSPVPLWWWSGDRVTADRLRRQLDIMSAGGVHNLVVINLAPNGPNRGALTDDPPLFSADWWGLWSELVTHARTIGTRLWFYDQLGFSSANLQGHLIVDDPDRAGAALDSLVIDVPPGVTESLSCSGFGTPISATICEIDENGSPAGVPDPVALIDDGVVWTAPSDGTATYRLTLAYSRPHGYDYLSSKACTTLLDVVHGEFERRFHADLGTTIVGSFQDELPSVPTWSQDFATEFADRAGYRLEPVISALFDDVPALNDGISPAQVRLDYHQVRAELAEEAFFRPLRDWHDRHGMLVGCDQQGEARAAEPLDTVRQYANYLRTHRWFSAPGSDHHGDAKVHSSLVHHHGGDRVWIEAFHSSGWGSTLEETFDWLIPWLLAGATLFNPHAVYYSTRGGWFEWAPPSSCWRQPYWQHYRHFTDTISRLCWLLSRGSHVCTVGVLHPTATVQANTTVDDQLDAAHEAHACYLRLTGRLVWFRPEPGVLPAAGVDFDIVDDETMAVARIEHGQVWTATEKYGVLLVPGCSVLTARTAEQLVTLAQSGGVVIMIGSLPRDSDTAAGRAACDHLRDLVARGTIHHVENAEDVTPLLPIGDVRVDDGITLHRRIGDREVLVVPAAPSGTATNQPPVREGRSWRDHLNEHGYDFDPRRWRDSAQVTLPADAGDIEQWDPYGGRAEPARWRSTDEGPVVTVNFDKAPLAVLVWRRGAARRHSMDPEHRPTSGSRITLADRWSAELVPTIDNSDGDFDWPGRAGPAPVQQRRLEQLDAASGEWREVLVGYGPWAWRFGPVATDALPSPLPPDHVGALHGEEWLPVEYSLSRGIEKDPMHVRSLGPNGRVPEEFWHVDHVEPCQSVVLRTRIPVPSGSAGLTLAIGANADIEVRWNGEALSSTSDPDGYLRLFPLLAAQVPEVNVLEVTCHATDSGPMRGYWAMTHDPDAFLRPEWLSVPPGRNRSITFRRELHIDHPASTAVIQLATVGSATLVLNSELVATHGSYEPYGIRHRVQPYDVTARLRPGCNLVEVRFSPGDPAALLIDALITFDDGTEQVLCTDSSWTMTLDGEEFRGRLERRRLSDPRFVQLFGRPHPLPRSRWLNDDCPVGGVLDLVPQAQIPQHDDELRFRTLVPPGATTVQLPPVAGTVRAHVDGRPCRQKAGVIDLPNTCSPARVLELTVHPTSGAVGGAVWDGPLRYTHGDGVLVNGDWESQGLAGYAGGATYRQSVELPPHQSATLDLGTVRGTASVRINGHQVGTRIWSPYRVELTPYTRNGANTIEVTVFNTLAGYLDDASPTHMVYPGQRRAGLFGPAHITTFPVHDPEEEQS